MEDFRAESAQIDAGDHYLLPRNLCEQDRLEFQHYALYRLLGTHFLAPVEQPRTVLDVGTGTGIWAKEAARRWSEARVLALDCNLSLLRRLPPNCRAIRRNVLQGTALEDGCSDYTHQRFLGAAIPLAAWEGLLNELLRVTAPGGWIELLELSDECLRPGPQTLLVQHWMQAFSRRRQIELAFALELPERLEMLGLKPAVALIEAPLWQAAKAGRLFQRDTLQALQGLTPFLAEVAGMTPAELERLINTLPAEWERYQTCWRCIAAWVQL
jgi:SAM-dependent methyltransferase